ncbi:MAG: LysR substrate-binding domain-containing protein [Caulobacterales bacterium]
MKNVRYFIAVAEARSVAGATLLLNISQSAVTEAIKALETDLGAALFERHARGMVLTHAGHQFLRHAHQILESVREAKQALSIRPDALAGTLNIGVTPLVTGYFLPVLLDRYQRVFPKVKVHVVEDERPYIEHLLVNGEIDVALLMVSLIENRQALDAYPVIQSSWRVWLPVSHRLCEQEAVSAADLKDECLIMTRLEELEGATRPLWAAVGQPQQIIRTASVEAVRSLVANGAGATILPDVLYRPWSLEGERIEWRPLKEAIPALEIGVAWRGGLKRTEPTENFLLVAQEYARMR